MILFFASFFACAGLSSNGSGSNAPSAAAAVVDPRSLSLVTLQGEVLSQDILDGKVVLFVNVASECGFTGQYDGLQSLYDKHQKEGLVIVGVPCNQFGGQESGSPQQIATFCKKNFGVSFPLLEKQDVNGANRSALYTALINSSAGRGRNVFWNFEKFLVGRDGKVLDRFGSNVKPNSTKLTSAIEAAL